MNMALSHAVFRKGLDVEDLTQHGIVHSATQAVIFPLVNGEAVEVIIEIPSGNVVSQRIRKPMQVGQLDRVWVPSGTTKNPPGTLVIVSNLLNALLLNKKGKPAAALIQIHAYPEMFLYQMQNKGLQKLIWAYSLEPSPQYFGDIEQSYFERWSRDAQSTGFVSEATPLKTVLGGSE